MAFFAPRYILLLDKEPDVTAFSYVPKLRKMFQTKKIGHAGTLDPFATGLMTYAIGRATAALQFIESLTKVYRVEAVFGKATDSFDRDGEVVEILPATELKERFESTDLAAAVHRVAARGEQTVPIYSALKKDGKPYYQYAREGQTIELPTRYVDIEVLDIGEPVWTDKGPSLTFTLCVSKGTYIRSFVEDLGRATGLLAYCQNLRRLSVGSLDLDGACDFETLKETVAELDLVGKATDDVARALFARGLLYDLEGIFQDHPAIALQESEALAYLHGKKLTFDVTPGVYAMTHKGHILGFAEQKQNREPLKSLRVFYAASEMER